MTCQNCDGQTHAAHPDICCTCFSIAFGSGEHRLEHRDFEVEGIAPIDKRRAEYAPSVSPSTVREGR